uniref:Uncharacterized protein n=1 Tax=Rhizophora mucronata TaxID=61149 RepID=A0A2P2IZN0_RHIMU
MCSTPKWHKSIGFWRDLKSGGIQFLRVTKIFWIVMNVPEQRHDLPTFWN